MMLPQHKLLKDPLGMMIASLAISKPRTSQATYERMRADAEAGMVVGQWTGIDQYCMDCWMIFVVGTVVDTQDKELRTYLEFIRDCGELPPAYWVDGVWFRPEPLKIMRLKG